MKKIFQFIPFIVILIGGCRKNPEDYVNPTIYNPDWAYASHESVHPNYEVVLPQNAVNKIELTINANNWYAIGNNMNSLFGVNFGEQITGSGLSPTTDPLYVDVDLRFNGKLWKNVGFRLKGNSSLFTPWNQGIYKLPFHLNFDKFEDQYPGIKNQHFYGFEELSLSPGFNDPSLIREKLASDIYRLGGIASAKTAFYRVYADIGNGMKYWGLYCGVEIPDDNMIKDQLGEEEGNIYKPESRFNIFDQTEFAKVNNETANDFSDVQELITILNSPLRISNNAMWKTNLESKFNVDYFLRWLAINNAMVNWDSYGDKAHNYYLYHHSTKNLLWIPWDNSEALKNNPQIVGAIGGNGTNGLSLCMNEVTANWPLIRYLIDDADYLQRYKDLLKAFKNETFNNATIDAMIDHHYDLITPYVTGAEGEQPGYTYLSGPAAFENEKNYLKNHIRNRNSLISSYLP